MTERAVNLLSSQQPPDDQPTLRDEDPALAQQLSVGNVAVVGETGVGGVCDK